MTKAEVIAALEGIKDMTSVVSIHSMLEMLDKIEPEVTETKVFGINQDVLDAISNDIENCLDRRSCDLVDNDTAEFEINYDNRIELSSADVRVDVIMEHVNACLEKFLMEDEEVISSEFTPVEEDIVELERGTIDNEEADEDSRVTIY
jgi:hypothetical protein